MLEVTRVRRYPKKRFPTQLVYGNTEDPALRLITCEGSFDSTTGHFMDNVVVFDAVPPHPRDRCCRRRRIMSPVIVLVTRLLPNGWIAPPDEPFE
ncbi:MAG: class F sortase [Actinobacteria bacterium]|nr:class F sortase [Actinomycetota bacterium]